jgi:hypothetical protein
MVLRGRKKAFRINGLEIKFLWGFAGVHGDKLKVYWVYLGVQSVNFKFMQKNTGYLPVLIMGVTVCP